MENLINAALVVGSVFLTVLVFVMIIFIVNWFDEKINGSWEEKIERVGTTKIKLNAGYYDVYVYNYYYRADEVDISSGFHWEYRGSEYTEELANKKQSGCQN